MALAEDLTLAARAYQPIGDTHEECASEHGFDPFVEARLTDVVHRLRRSWLAGPALLWGDVHPIRELARGDLEKRVATALASGFFQFSQFLAGFEVLALELQKSGVVSEKSLLGLEKLLQKGGGPFVDEGRVAQSAHSLGDVSRGGDRGGDAADC